MNELKVLLSEWPINVIGMSEQKHPLVHNPVSRVKSI